MSLRQWLVGGFAVGLMASVLLAKPGIVTTLSGQKFTGDVTEDDGNVYVNGAGGQLTFKRAGISSVEYTASVEDEYNQQHAKLKANDVAGRIALANWANDHQRSDLAVKALQEARQIDPSNKDAAHALDAAERQTELDHSTPASPAKPAATAPTPTLPPGTPAPTAPKAPAAPLAKPAPQHRLLNADEINIIRQKEMTSDDTRAKIRFENGVVKKYLATGDHNATEFKAQTPMNQALEILTNGDASLAKDVRVVTDPEPLWQFRTKVYPIISTGCIGCHNGNKGGNFSLFPGESVDAVYTDFYILQSYSATVDKVKYLALDRDAPDHSLVLQYGLPLKMGVPAHPAAPDWRPRFRSSEDPSYQLIADWLKNSLRVIKPDYGLNVSATPVTKTEKKPAAAP
jgi:hypothetical protein